jgi:hypothetical protein
MDGREFGQRPARPLGRGRAVLVPRGALSRIGIDVISPWQAELTVLSRWLRQLRVPFPHTEWLLAAGLDAHRRGH